MDPEDSIKVILEESNPSIWGHRVAKGLEKEPTSWVLLTLAAHYWRTQGQSLKAVDCLRRALHYSSRLSYIFRPSRSVTK